MQTFQGRVREWLISAGFSTVDEQERAHRFIRKAIELAVLAGVEPGDIRDAINMALAEKREGKLHPAEVAGGVQVTFAGLCIATGLSMELVAETELERVKMVYRKPTMNLGFCPICAEEITRFEGGNIAVCGAGHKVERSMVLGVRGPNPQPDPIPIVPRHEPDKSDAYTEREMWEKQAAGPVDPTPPDERQAAEAPRTEHVIQAGDIVEIDVPESSGEFLARLGADAFKWGTELSSRLPAIQAATEPNMVLAQWFANAMEAALTHAPINKRIQDVRNCHEIQMNPGNALANEYMRGMANGLELAMSILEGREVAYIQQPKAA